MTNSVHIRRDGVAGSLPLEARMQKMILYPDIEEMRANGRVIITQGQSIVSGSAMLINNKTGISVLDGPVTATFHSANHP